MVQTKKIRVVMVEDTFVKRELLKQIIHSNNDMEVVKSFSTGEMAINYIKENEVDVVTMDINLPGIDGFETSRRILQIRKIPIVIITSLKNPSNEFALFKAMRENGALALLDSPQPPGNENFERSARKITATLRAMADTSYMNFPVQTTLSDTISLRTKFDFSKMKIIAMGISTGGPIVLEKILSALPKDFSIPIVIVQHILKGFGELLASSLSKACKIQVKLAEDNETIKAGTAYISPSDKKISITKENTISLLNIPDEVIILDTVSYLFASVANTYGDKAVAVLLTGMGRDGAKELKILRNCGAYTIAQDKESSAIFGMPGEAIKINAAVDIMPPNQIACKLNMISEVARKSL